MIKFDNIGKTFFIVHRHCLASKICADQNLKLNLHFLLAS